MVLPQLKTELFSPQYIQTLPTTFLQSGFKPFHLVLHLNPVKYNFQKIKPIFGSLRSIRAKYCPLSPVSQGTIANRTTLLPYLRKHYYLMLSTHNLIYQ